MAKNLFNSFELDYEYDEAANKIKVNGIEVDARDKGTYVPLRAVAEGLGYKVNWYQQSMSVSIGK